MTSQGQRFRRRALRRGYKVDEVDLFLDRVEATLNGEARGSAVNAAEVHDVVFRVRFGGYDEWQVDLHLDRVERQLAEMAERGPIVPAVERRAVAGAGAARPPADRFADERYPSEDRFGALNPRGDDRATGPLPPVRDDRPPARPVGPAVPAAGSGFGAAAPAAGAFGAAPAAGSFGGPPAAGYGGTGGGFGTEYSDPRFDGLRGEPRFDDARADSRYEEPMGRRYDEPPPRGATPAAPPRYEEPVRYEEPARYEEPPPRYDEPGRSSYPGFEPGRHGKMDMTAEIRMPADISAPAPALTGEAGRVDQLRRTFHPRRFGSGYDPAQVDRLFDGIVAAVANRSAGQISEADLDPGQFNLVPGGYFEAEVDQALREVRDLLRNRR